VIESAENVQVTLEKNTHTKKVRQVFPSEVGYAAPQSTYFTPKSSETALPFDRFDPNTLPYQRWGDGDNVPTWVREQLEAVPLSMRVMKRLVEMMCGEGIGYAARDGGAVKPEIQQEIEDFLLDNHLNGHWLPNQCLDFVMLCNAFPELEKKGGKIVGLYHKPAAFVRLAQQSKTSHRIEYALYSPEFAHGRTLTDYEKKHFASLSLVPKVGAVRYLKAAKDGNYIYHTGDMSSGTDYYARIAWLELLGDEGWLQSCKEAPKQALHTLRNQTILKYLITVPMSYFRIRHFDWDQKKKEEREIIIAVKIKEIKNFLENNEESNFKSFAQICEEDEDTLKRFGEITIQVIDDKPKNGYYIIDTAAADLQMVNILGLNPNQLELSNQKGQSAGGAGSDGRVGFNTHIMTNTVYQWMMLHILNVISAVNGWNVVFFVKHDMQAALNMEKTGKTDANAPEKDPKKQKGLNDGRSND
jgi:hypothetical protein